MHYLQIKQRSECCGSSLKKKTFFYHQNLDKKKFYLFTSTRGQKQSDILFCVPKPLERCSEKCQKKKYNHVKFIDLKFPVKCLGKKKRLRYEIYCFSFPIA